MARTDKRNSPGELYDNRCQAIFHGERCVRPKGHGGSHNSETFDWS